MQQLRILFVTKSLPWPANSGEKQRSRELVRAMKRLGHVTVVGFQGPHENPDLALHEGVDVRSVLQSNKGSVPGLVWRALRWRSITAGKWWDVALARIVDDEIRKGVDIIVVVHVQLSVYLPHQRGRGTISVLDMQNIESLLTRRLSQTTRWLTRIPLQIEAVALRRLETRMAPRFDMVTVVSVPDRTELAKIVAHECVRVVPNAISGDDHRALSPALEPVVCFVGLMSWAPNADAAVAFVEHVWPSVRAAVPSAQLLLVGREPTAAVRALADEDVVVTGTVEDVVPWYEKSRVAIAPLLAGGGSRLKILEALAMGRPVVASPVGAEGLEDLVGRGVIVADGSEAMATELIALLSDPDRCGWLGTRGADAVREDHSWKAATEPLLRQIEVLGGV